MATQDSAAPIMRSPENFVETSGWLAFAGITLMLATWILVGAMEATRGERDGQPDACQRRVRLYEITQRYRHSYSPGWFFWNSIQTHVGKGGHRSKVYKVVWWFLPVWLAMTGFYLLLASSWSEIDLYRAEELTTATFTVSISLVLAAAWLPLVKLGSYSDEEERAYLASVLQKRIEKNEKIKNPCELHWDPVPRRDNKSFSLPSALLVLFLAFCLAVNACVRTQAWTLPSDKQVGLFLFVAPGFSLFAGWLGVATMLCCGLTVSYFSAPDGNLERPTPQTPAEAKQIANLYPPSLFPILVAIIIGSIAIAIPDPVLPAPLWLTLLVFTPYVTENLTAAFIGVVCSGVAALRVLSLREAF